MGGAEMLGLVDHNLSKGVREFETLPTASRQYRFTILPQFCNCPCQPDLGSWRQVNGTTMKPIEQNEIYEHLSQFLKGRGIEMKNGSYAQTIQKSCSLLTDAVNLTQQGMGKAKSEIDKRLDQMREVIHKKTAPKPPPSRDRTETRS